MHPRQACPASQWPGPQQQGPRICLMQRTACPPVAPLATGKGKGKLEGAAAWSCRGRSSQGRAQGLHFTPCMLPTGHWQESPAIRQTLGRALHTMLLDVMPTPWVVHLMKPRTPRRHFLCAAERNARSLFYTDAEKRNSP